MYNLYNRLSVKKKNRCYDRYNLLKVTTPMTARIVFPGLTCPNVFVCKECAKRVRKEGTRHKDGRYRIRGPNKFASEKRGRDPETPGHDNFSPLNMPPKKPDQKTTPCGIRQRLFQGQTSGDPTPLSPATPAKPTAGMDVPPDSVPDAPHSSASLSQLASSASEHVSTTPTETRWKVIASLHSGLTF